MNTRRITRLIAVAVGVLAGAPAWAQSDGEPPAATFTRARPEGARCAVGARACPAYPKGVALDAKALAEALEHLIGCSVEDHGADRAKVLQAGRPEAVSAALAHVVLVDAGLSLHARKLGLELMAELGAEAGVEHLTAAFEDAKALAELSFVGLQLPQEDLQKMVELQAEELRRVVVLAAARDPQPGIDALLARAARDPGRSVAQAAQQARALRAQAGK